MSEQVVEQTLQQTVNRIVGEVRITDVHTHLYPPAFNGLLLWGVDELLTYHYLIAETMRWVDLPYEKFWQMSKREQADLIWQTLFIENTPYSEACRGVLTTLQKLGLDTSSRNLASYRAYFAGLSVEEYVDRIFELAGLEAVVMTNDPFDPVEREVWLQRVDSCSSGGKAFDERFRAALRLDALLNEWQTSWQKLREWGFAVSPDLDTTTQARVREFLEEWVERMQPVYMAVSLPCDFVYPEESARGILIEECVLPVCRQKNLPLALMIGVKRQINAGLQTAGDGVGKADIGAVEYLCSHYPQNKFLVTMLARENQHELCVVARKFRNLMPFGCWWFLNNPSLVDEITRMRFELLGVSVILQHSDARVLDQLTYKWEHSRRVIAAALVDKYRDLLATGWKLTEAEIRRDASKLLGGNFWDFMQRKL